MGSFKAPTMKPLVYRVPAEGSSTPIAGRSCIVRYRSSEGEREAAGINPRVENVPGKGLLFRTDRIGRYQHYGYVDPIPVEQVIGILVIPGSRSIK